MPTTIETIPLHGQASLRHATHPRNERLKSASETLFDEAYYQRFISTRKPVADPQHLERLGAFCVQLPAVPARTRCATRWMWAGQALACGRTVMARTSAGQLPRRGIQPLPSERGLLGARLGGRLPPMRTV